MYLIRDVTDMHRFQNGQFKLSLEDVTFSDIVSDIDRMYRKQAEARRLQLEIIEDFDSAIHKVKIDKD